MAKLELDDISNLRGSPTTAQSTINGNSLKIEEAFENTLSRDGTSPNTMEADLDLNGHRLLNLPEPATDTEPLRRADLNLLEGGILSPGQVGTAELADLSVTAAKLASNSVITSKILDDNVTSAKILANAVTTAKIADSNVTFAKLDSSTQTLINQGVSAYLASTQNYIDNGAMMVSQENGTTVGTGANYYPVDRFSWVRSNGGGSNTAQVASLTPAGSPNRIRMTVNGADAAVAAADYALINHTFDGTRIAPWAFGTASAKTVVLRFGWRSPAGTYSVCLSNAANNRRYIRTFTVSGGDANIDTVQTVTFPGDTTGTWPTTTAYAAAVIWCVMAGTDWHASADTWITTSDFATSAQTNVFATNGQVVELFDVGMYIGTTAPTFLVPDYAEELRKCRRWYWKDSTPNWVWAENISAGAATNYVALSVHFPVEMRTVPTVTLPTCTLGGVPSIATGAVLGNTATGCVISGLSNVGAGGRLYFLYSSGTFIADAR